MELEAGIAGRENSPRVVAFVDALTASPELSQLAGLPFYCVVLLDEFRKSVALPADALATLDTIVERMLSREGDKLVFQWRDFVDLDVLEEIDAAPALDAGRLLADGRRQKEWLAQVLDEAGRDNLRHMLGMVAHQRVRHVNADIDISDLREAIAPAFVAGRTTAEDGDRVLLSVVQFAFFGAGKKAGTVDFTHPILAEHMAAGYALHLLRCSAERVREIPAQSAMSRLGIARGALRQALGTARLEPSSVFVRALSRGIGAEPSLQEFLRSTLALLGKDDRKLAAHVDLLLKE